MNDKERLKRISQIFIEQAERDGFFDNPEEALRKIIERGNKKQNDKETSF